MNKKQIIAITGPTASGKTGLATILYDQLDIELINMDSAQVYKGMDIGSAKLSQEELQKYPHYLVDICQPTETYSAASFVEDAQKLAREIIFRGKTPVLVGGTMLYYKAFSEGLADLPSADEALRSDLRQIMDEQGHQALYEELYKIDPQTALRLQGNDTQRLIRFVEIARLTGQAPSALFAAQAVQSEFDFLHIAFLPKDRAQLHNQIELRFDEMLKLGFIDEVQSLIDTYSLDESMQSMRCVGYRQILQYLNGKLSYEDMREKGIIATRQLAKRQYTWLRKLRKDIVLTDPFDVPFEQIIERIKSGHKN